MKYQVYRYHGIEATVGRTCIVMEQGDLFCMIDNNRAKIGSVLVAGVCYSSFLHDSKYIGDHTLSEYNVMVQNYLNVKYHLDNDSVEVPYFKYVEPNSILAGVKIKRG